MFKSTALIIFVTFLVVFNIVLNSFASCCESDKELFFNSEERGCCICCTAPVDKTFLANRSSGISPATIKNGNACLCMPYASISDNYFVFNKRTILTFLFSPAVLAVSFVVHAVNAKYHTFSPRIVDQMTESLSTVVLLV